jgi:hypothetical protein
VSIQALDVYIIKCCPRILYHKCHSVCHWPCTLTVAIAALWMLGEADRSSRRGEGSVIWENLPECTGSRSSVERDISIQGE